MECINLSEMVSSLDAVGVQGGEISNYQNIPTNTHQVFALILAIFCIKAKRGVDSNFYYIGIEAIGQFVELMNYHFKTRGIENCMSIHMSLFELEKIKRYIKQVKGKKIIFLFKTIDSLEILQRDYSKKFLLDVVPLVDRVVVSFATRSMIKKEKFGVNRNWILGFIKDNFKITDKFRENTMRGCINY